MNPDSNYKEQNALLGRFGFIVGLVTAFVTLGTFILALMTPPLSGPFCTGNCFEYPFTETGTRFPRDYLWMYPSMMVTLLYVVLMLCIYQYAPLTKKIFGLVGVSVAIISAAILIPDYFIQVTVIQPALVLGEMDGLALLSQYNSHGIFIALEEISYMLMNLSFFAVVPVFSGYKGSAGVIRITFITGFLLSVAALIFISARYGIFREYIYEVVIISIVWLQLIIASVSLAIIFHRDAEPGSPISGTSSDLLYEKI